MGDINSYRFFGSRKQNKEFNGTMNEQILPSCHESPVQHTSSQPTRGRQVKYLDLIGSTNPALAQTEIIHPRQQSYDGLVSHQQKANLTKDHTHRSLSALSSEKEESQGPPSQAISVLPHSPWCSWFALRECYLGLVVEWCQ